MGDDTADSEALLAITMGTIAPKHRYIHPMSGTRGFPYHRL